VIEQKPFHGTAFTVPGTIEAEDYDQGGQGISFHDQDLVNQGGAYRTGPVDIGELTAGVPGHYVGWTAAGEWLEYTIAVNKGMKVNFTLLLACANGGGELHFELNGKMLTNHLFIGATGGEQQFKAFTLSDIYLPEGVHQLRLVTDKGEMNIDHIHIGERISTEVRNMTRTPGIKIYPNPVHDQFRINMDTNQKTEVQLISLHGQIVKVFEMSPGSGTVFSVSGLPAGTYIVCWIVDGKVFRDKIVKL
jgi:hypothetical protein